MNQIEIDNNINIIKHLYMIIKIKNKNKEVNS
jgi:hypothetical protein